MHLGSHGLRPFVTLLGMVLGIANFGIAQFATADVFHYRDGRVISGEVVGQPTERKINNIPTTVWTVKVAPGSYVQVFESELIRNGHEVMTDFEKAYAQEVVKLEDTADEHCRMAAWCMEHSMRALADAHYRRALDLDPSHNDARVAAGYKMDDNGRWVTVETIYGERRGKVLHKNRWRFPESVAIEKAEEEEAAKIAPLKKQLSTWHRNMATQRGDARIKALEGIRQIQDPMAVGIIAGYLLDTRKPPSVALKHEYIRVLSRFENFASANTLAECSITDPTPAVRNACLDALQGFGAEVAIPKYISYLGNSNNELVNRAGQALGQFNPEEAILPLISALNTEHVEDANSGPNMNLNLQGGLSFGGGPKKVKINRKNEGVYGTLTQITGGSFGYNEDQWMAWYARTYAAPAPDLRRDP